MAEAREDIPDRLRMLVFDTSYTSNIIFERGLTQPILARDLDGFFERIWTVQPLDTIFLPPGDRESSGAPRTFEIAPRHVFIAGKLMRFAWPRWAMPLNFFLAQVGLLRLLSRLIRDHRIAIIRAEDSWYCGLLALILARRHRLPLIVGVWGNPAAIRKATGRPLMPRLFRRIWVEEMVERFVLKRADRIIVQNEDNRRFVLSMGAEPRRTRIFRLGNILHPMHFEEPATRPDGRAELAELGLEGSQVLLVISRLETLKRTDHAVKMLAGLGQRCPQAKLLFAGDGSQRSELEHLAAELGVEDRVVFAGNRDQDWLWRVTPRVAAVVSLLTGRSLAEAALAGVPLIAYDADWQGELVATGFSGELVPDLDHEGLARAAERILEDPDYARRMGAGARRKALEMLDPESNSAAQRAEYRELLNETRA